MKIKIRRRYLFFILAISSALIAAIVSGIDTIATGEIADPSVLTLSCFILGVLVSFLLGIFLSIKINGKPIGKKIEPSFRGLRFLKKEEIKYHLLAGFGNATFTIGYFYLLFKISEPSVVLAFSQVTILYLVIFESITEKDTPTLIEVQSAIIVTFGAILGSISLRGTVSLEDLAVVFFIINPGWMIFTIYQRKLKLLKINKNSNDAINIRVWNVFFAMIFSFIFILSLDFYYGTNNLINCIVKTINYAWIMGIIAIGTFFNFILYLRALGIGKASVTQAVKSSVVLFAIPVTIVLSLFGYEGLNPDPVMLLIKMIGVVLIILGISSFALTLTKAYIFIKLKSGNDIEEIMKKLWDIRGVTRVCAVAGHYDIILKIRTRTLVKGYERILRKVQEVQGIDEYRWQSVLKEWEDI
jgi:DNA-binding Lrp family transcriptional regulator